MSSLARAYRMQSMIVHALMMRNMQTRNSNSRLGLILNVIEPALMIFTIIAMRFYLSGSGQVFGMPLALFVTTGFMPYHFSRMIVNDITGAARNKTPVLMFPSVTSLDGIIARILLASIVFTLTVIISFVIVIEIYGGSPPNDYLLAAIALCMILWYSAILGVLFGVASRIFPVVTLLIPPLMRVSILLSGALYLAVELPPSILRIAVWNPLFVGIEMMREAWIEGYVSPAVSPNYFLGANLVLTVVALSLERLTRRFKFS